MFSTSGCSVEWNPCIPEGYTDTTEQEMLMSKYGLDEKEGKV